MLIEVMSLNQDSKPACPVTADADILCVRVCVCVCVCVLLPAIITSKTIKHDDKFSFCWEFKYRFGVSIVYLLYNRFLQVIICLVVSECKHLPSHEHGDTMPGKSEQGGSGDLKTGNSTKVCDIKSIFCVCVCVCVCVCIHIKYVCK